ncbi:amidohydrolase family protein [Cryobacterium sp. SO2]|uniref:amidohydrolase family protein n=1 Tax=Cryobacterium sp. SO2 TaxID=1897060 RepID=UPI00223C90F7|nr:amidohydrolase family protein [Cryobacterium sp. SO2]WEO76991.1 amidohydrolase family protein [Cryobacterium sp. SO2]
MTVLPAFLDAHVHLALIDPAALAAGGIGRVLDLGGWTPTGASVSAAGSSASFPEAHFAGQFLGAPGGYPSRQAWAPDGSACAVGSPAEAADAVDRQAAAGASVIKVTLNSAAGPVLAADTLAAIVAAAHERMLPVAAHTEGAGQAAAAFTAGVDLLAHTPFSEALPAELLGAMAGRLTWISTLDIHGWGRSTAAFHVASDNLARFHAVGGRVLYGTDLGNGPLPVGLNRREIEALLACGLSPDDVLAALTADVPGYPAGPAPATPATGIRPTGPHGVTVISGDRPTDPHDLAGFTDWLLSAQILPATALPAHVLPAHSLTRPDPEDLRS